MSDFLVLALESMARTYLVVAAMVFLFFAKTAVHLIFDPPSPKFTSWEVFCFCLMAAAAALSWPALLWESVRDGVNGLMQDRRKAQVIEFLGHFKDVAEQMAKEQTENKEEKL